MITETILTDEQIVGILHNTPLAPMPSHHVVFARAIEQAVLQSPEIQELKKDVARIDWLADPNNSIGNVQLPTECVTENLHSLRAAIDAAMEKQP